VKVLRCPQCKAGIPVDAVVATPGAPAALTGLRHERVTHRSEFHPPHTAANMSPHADTNFDHKPMTSPAEEEPVLAEDAFPEEEIVVAEDAVPAAPVPVVPVDEVIVAEDASLEDCVIQSDPAEEEPVVLEAVEDSVPVAAVVTPPPPKLGGILGVNDLVFRVVGKAPLRYEVLETGTWKPLGNILERTDEPSGEVSKRKPGDHMVIREGKKDKLLLSLRRRHYRPKDRTDVFDGRGRLVGYLEIDLEDMLDFRVKTFAKKEYAVGRGQWQPRPLFRFYTLRGQGLGGMSLEAVNAGEAGLSLGWHLTLNEVLSASPAAKLLLLGAAVAFDVIRLTVEDPALRRK
jgi:hypothetical protein